MYRRDFYKLIQSMEETDQVWTTDPSLSNFAIFRKKPNYFIKESMLKLCLVFTSLNTMVMCDLYWKY